MMWFVLIFLFILGWYLVLMAVLWLNRSKRKFAVSIRRKVSSFSFMQIMLVFTLAFSFGARDLADWAYDLADDGHMESMFDFARQNLPADGQEPMTTYHGQLLLNTFVSAVSDAEVREGFDRLGGFLELFVLVTGGAFIGVFVSRALENKQASGE